MQPPTASAAISYVPRPNGVQSPASPPSAALAARMPSMYARSWTRARTSSAAANGTIGVSCASRPLASTRLRKRRFVMPLSRLGSGWNSASGGAESRRPRASCQEQRSAHTQPVVSAMAAERSRPTGPAGTVAPVADAPDLDLLAASLRADATDTTAFLEALAARLEGALPGQVDVQRKGGLFGGGKRVRRIAVRLGDSHYEIEGDGGRPSRR